MSLMVGFEEVAIALSHPRIGSDFTELYEQYLENLQTFGKDETHIVDQLRTDS
jgi:hypothetical protein